MESYTYLHDVSLEVDFTSTGDKMIFTPPVPVDIIRWGVIANALIDVGAGMVVKGDFRPTSGSDGSRGDGDVGDITLGVDADIAQGEGAYTGRVNPGLTGDAQKTPFQVDPGEEVVFQVTDAADTAGTGLIWVQYQARAFVGDSAVTAGTASNRIANMASND
jgi:hypothetical protein